MKKIRIAILSAALSALALMSSCKYPTVDPAAGTTISETDPDISPTITEDGIIEDTPPLPAASVTTASQPVVSNTELELGGNDADAEDLDDDETASRTGFFKDPFAVTPEEIEALYEEKGWDDDTVIHLPNQTAPEDFVPIDAKTPTGNSVFLVCVDADTTDEMMNEVIADYGLSVVYDYENFNMYALSVPSPLDDEETQRFIKELESAYDFILSVEPDSIVTLDGASAQ